MSKEKIYESMENEMPFAIGNHPKPYILEAMDIHAKEELLDFIDWFGTWQMDKNLDDYGINDIHDHYISRFKKLSVKTD